MALARWGRQTAQVVSATLGTCSIQHGGALLHLSPVTALGFSITCVFQGNDFSLNRFSGQRNAAVVRLQCA